LLIRAGLHCRCPRANLHDSWRYNRSACPVPRKPIPLYRSLVINIAVSLLIMGGGIFGVMYYNSLRQIETLSRNIVGHTLTQTRSELDRFFEPVISDIGIASRWLRSGMLSARDGESMHKLLAPMLRQSPQISSILLADDAGNEFMLMHHQSRWQTRQILKGRWQDKARIRRYLSNGRIETVFAALDYDSRRRPWFRNALQALPGNSRAQIASDVISVSWTEPYTFYTSRDPGVTASTAYRDTDGKTHVLGVDILLNDVAAFTANMNISAHGMAITMTDDGRIIGMSARTKAGRSPETEKNLLRPLTSTQNPILRAALSAREAQVPGYSGPYRFSEHGETWWAGSVDYPLSSKRKLVSMVLLPERDVYGNLKLFSAGVLLLFGLTALLSIIRIRRLASRYSRPVSALVEDSVQISMGNFDGTETINSSVMEIQQLAQAHKTMRQGLRTLLKMERDMQIAHDIQKRLLPASLPQLSAYQLAGWYSPADATGGDSYDVIGLKTLRNTRRLSFTEDNPQQLLLMLADATGHGIGPALTSTQMRAMLRMAVLIGCELPEMLKYLNQQMCMDLHSGRFVTLWLGLLDVRNHTLRSYSAGQAPLLFYSAAQHVIETLDADAPPLGIMEELSIPDPGSRVFEIGDIFLVLSDGLFEAKNAHGEAFGIERVRNIILAYHHASAEQLLQIIVDALTTFTHAARAADDRTALLIKRNGE